jgi:hypothetical protein
MLDLGTEVQVWGIVGGRGWLTLGGSSLSPRPLSASKDADDVGKKSGRPLREFLYRGSRGGV